MNRFIVLGFMAVIFAAAPLPSWSQTIETIIEEDDVSAMEPDVEGGDLSSWYYAMQSRLNNSENRLASDEKRSSRLALWYEQRDYAPLWLADGQPTREAREVVFALLTAYEDGLNPAEYGADTMLTKLNNGDEESLADFEVSLSYAVALYGQHLHSGRVEPNQVNRELVLFPEEISADKILERLAQADDVIAELRDFSPNTDRYDRLRKHLQSLIVTKAKGGWVQVPDGETLKPGMSDPRVAVLRERMIQEGELKEGVHSGDTYDAALVDAVMEFQRRMGLEQDGAIGPNTLTELNTTVEERIRLVELNLERRRWMQANFGNPYVFVNLADQTVKFVKDEKTIHAALTQVGASYHRTPVFSDQMEYLEFNPYWNVPYSIATKEYLPKLKSNPYALKAQNINVLRNETVVDPGGVPWNSYSRAKFPVKLRQEPGAGNALGRVKFMFPNQFNIYLHDTPSKSKFDKAQRYFSHGCIRVQDPFDLAEVILKDQGMTRAEIDQIVNSGKRTVVRLQERIPVHVAYLTAWVNKDGSVYYRRDVYGRDKILDEALTAATN